MRYLTDWPGKSAETNGIDHPAVYHMLDVAAVAERLIAPEQFSVPLKQALILLAALHDLGKIGRRFRNMLRTGAAQGRARHWHVTEALLEHHQDLLLDLLGGEMDVHYELYAATAGHHGRPPESDIEALAGLATDAGAQAREDAKEVIVAFMDLWPEASLEGVSLEVALALSWWLPGLVTAADWIGSNTRWFPAQAPGPDVGAYLAQTRLRAARAVRESGMDRPPLPSTQLFDFEAPRPMQVACAGIELAEGAMLAVIEDETGAGKTEAALILAQRMLRAGKGAGLYVALPTMATADAMFARVRIAMERLYSVPSSLTLAHGRAGLSEAFADLRGTGDRGPTAPNCADWLAESRRRALLANVGVGTIDQALLGVLPTRFSTLRLYGLASKVLIVDEVHELGDPYMQTELERLLEAHRALGGSAILLTATLPLANRRRLLAVYGGHERSDDPAYPALTVASGAARRDLPQETGPRGPVRVRRCAAETDLVAHLAEAARCGAACVWVRNAVDDAIAGAEALRAEGVEVDLLHARFALVDRKRHEADVLARYGRDRSACPGRILVATQVVESSLDLDFDVMASDLAPMAALIQRAGRLWRHMDRRPAAARPVPAPVLEVLSPDPSVVADPRWLAEVLGGGAWTYPLGVQWRTARVLFNAGEIVAPSGLRALIEAVEADTPVPAPLEDAEIARTGAGFAHANQARQNLVDLRAGYRAGGAGAQDTDYPTRLGQQMRVLCLARYGSAGLRPWASSEAEALMDWAALQLSEVQASARRLDGLPLPDQSTPEIAAFTADWPEWKRATVTVCPVAEDGQICDGLRYDCGSGLTWSPQ